MPVAWREKLPWSEVQDIQQHCREALRLWGYEEAKDEQHLRSFMPVGQFQLG